MKQNITVLNSCVGFLVVTLLMQSGCASGPRFTAAPQPASGKALVYLYRKSSFVGGAGYDKIYANNDYLGDLYSGGYCTIEVPAGTNAFFIMPRASWIAPLYVSLPTNLQNQKYEKLRFEAEAGKTYYVNVYVAFTGHAMKLVDETLGAKEISKVKLSKTGKGN